MITRSLQRFFTDDHRRLEDLLNRAVANPEKIDQALYEAFRRGLLKHIGMEERILLPAVLAARGGGRFPMASKLRMDHGALAALLVPPPSPQIISAIRAILTDHDPIEESPGGLYDLSAQLTSETVDALMARVRSAPEVSATPHNPDPGVLNVVRRILSRAGYNLDH